MGADARVPQLRVVDEGVYDRERGRTSSRSGSTTASPTMLGDLQRLTHANMADEIDRFIAALERRPDPARRLLEHSRTPGSVTLETGATHSARRRRRRRARGAARWRSGSAGSRIAWPRRRARGALARGDRERAVAAIRSQTSSGAAPAPSAARDCAGRARPASGPRSRARISGSVTVPSSRSVPRGLPVRSGGPETSRTSSRIWKATPICSPNAPSASASAAALERAELARGPEQDRGLQPAALEVALDADRRVATRRRAASAPRPPAPSSPARERRTAATEPPWRRARRTRARTAGRRSPSPVAGRRPRRPSAGRAAAPSRRARRRGRASRACTSSTATAARTSPSVSGGGTPAARQTSSGRSRLPPAAIVSPA